MTQPNKTVFQPKIIFSTLATWAVEYVVVGGYAALLHHVGIMTSDVDITPSLESKNLNRLASALGELQATIREQQGSPGQIVLPEDAQLLATCDIWNLHTRAGDLDVLLRPNGKTFDDLRPTASVVTVPGENYQLAVISIEDWVEAKQATGRAKDFEQLERFRELTSD